MESMEISELRRIIVERIVTFEKISISEVEPLFCPDENETASRYEEFSLSIILRGRKVRALNDLHIALKKIENGELGICTECGEDIGFRRLKANPAAEYCISCKEHLELMQRMGRVV